jgi:caffeoyl-CoA O-methyltransferase
VASRTDQPWLDAATAAYIAVRTEPADDVLSDLRAETETLGDLARMQVSADQGALLTLLTGVARATFAVEVGTFTGYSSVCIARGLQPGGRLLCLDVSEEYTAIARKAWAKAGLDDRIDLQIAPALESLQALPTDEHIDVAFIDADKPNYLNYFAELVPRLRPNGLIMVDNTLWSGLVVDPATGDENTEALKAFNDAIAADDRVDSYLLPVSDGLTLIRKR